MVLSFKFRSTSVPASSHGEQVFESMLPGHLGKATAALHHLDHLSHQSKRHDQNLIDDVKNRLSVSAQLPPRVLRRHHVTPRETEYCGRAARVGLSRTLSRDYSVPPLPEVHYSDNYNLGNVKRMSLAAETAVKQAHREVDRVERELSLGYRDPITARRQRSLSYAAPARATSVFVEPLGHHGYSSHHSYHVGFPSHSYQYESYHPDHTLGGYHSKRLSPSYELQVEAQTSKPLYSPSKLVRCLTDTHTNTLPFSSPPFSSISPMRKSLLTRSRSAQPLNLSIPTHHTLFFSSPSPPTTHLSRHASFHTTTRPSPILSRSLSLHHPPHQSPLSSVEVEIGSPIFGRHYKVASPVTDHVSKKTSVRSEGSFGRHYHHYYNTTPTHHVDALLPTVYSLPLTPNFHHYTHTTLPLDSNLTTTYPSLPPRPQFIPPSLSSSSSSSASSYVAKAAVLAATPTYLHTGLERPLQTHQAISDTRRRVRDVLCKTTAKVSVV